MTYGIKISKENNDARDSLREDLIAFSSYNSPKVILEDTASFEFSSASFQGISITHNLGYVPAFDMWVKVDGTDLWYSFAAGAEVSPGVNITWYADIDEQFLTLYARIEGGGNVTLHYHYLIFVDPGA